MKKPAPASPEPIAPPAPIRLSPAVVVLALLPAILAGAMFVQRASRPLEQGGDAYSDANTIMAGRNFAEMGFARLHFLPVEVPDPARPDPRPDEYYTHYPPGSELLNGLLQRIGIRQLRGFRLFSAGLSLIGLAFWFLALRGLFGDFVAVVGVATYALNFSFLWLGDSVHHYGYSDLLRSAALCFTIRLMEAGRRTRDEVALAMTLFLQSLVAYDYIPYSHAILLGLGVTGFRGPRLRRLLLFGAMPVLGVGLHLLQNFSVLGGGGALGDLGSAFLQRAFAVGGAETPHFTVGALFRQVIWNTPQIMGLGLAPILGLGAFGAAAWAATAPEASRGRGARVLIVVALASAIWFVAMHEHAAVHPFSNRQLLPLASLALALGLAGLHALVSPHSRRLAAAAVGVAALGLIADGASGYLNDENRRADTSRSFAVAYAARDTLPEGVPVASNIGAPAPPVLSELLKRRVTRARSLPELQASYGGGATIVFLYGRYDPIDRPLVDFLHRGRLLHMDDQGVAVEVTLEPSEPATP